MWLLSPAIEWKKTERHALRIRDSPHTLCLEYADACAHSAYRSIRLKDNHNLRANKTRRNPVGNTCRAGIWHADCKPIHAASARPRNYCPAQSLVIYMKAGRSIVSVILALSLVFSTVGVTVVGMACAGTSLQKSRSCPLCASSQPKKSPTSTKKSCCETIAKRITLRTAFVKPAQQIHQQFIVALLPTMLAAQLCIRAVPVALVPSSSPPADRLASQDRCALNGIYRI